MEITKQQYEYALNRIEELLPLVTDETPASDKNAVELTIVSDVVEAYEKYIIRLPNPLLATYQSLHRGKRHDPETTRERAGSESISRQ